MNRVYIHRCERLYSLYMDDANEKLIRSFSDVVSGGSRIEPFGHEELVGQMKGCEVLFSNCGLGAKDITNEVLRDVGTITLIVVGHNWNQFVGLDLGSLGIKLVEGSNANTVSVAEWVLSAALIGVRRIEDFSRKMKSGSLWGEPNRDQSSSMLKGKKVGLIGLGRVGRSVARLFTAFAADVSVWDDYVPDSVFAECGVTRRSLEEILSESDIVSLHLAISPSTRGLLGKRHFGLIKDGATFINSARAVLYDEEALIDELRKGRFEAYIDVFSTEPLPLESPLRTLPNVVISPHVAGNSVDMYTRCARESIMTIKDYFEGRPVVDRKYAK